MGFDQGESLMDDDDITCVPTYTEWQAFRDPEGLVGYGATKEEATQELLDREQSI
jgi:hypothetical protein